MGGIHNWVVREGWVRDDEVLLSSLEGLDEGKVRIVENLVCRELAVSNKTTIALFKVLSEEFVSLGSTKVRTDGATELFVLVLEKGDRLLEGLEQELFADARALSVFTVAFTGGIN